MPSDLAVVSSSDFEPLCVKLHEDLTISSEYVQILLCEDEDEFQELYEELDITERQVLMLIYLYVKDHPARFYFSLLQSQLDHEYNQSVATCPVTAGVCSFNVNTPVRSDIEELIKYNKSSYED